MKFYLPYLLICLSLPALLEAQDIRQVSGKVWDSTNNPLPRASIKLFYPGGKDTLQMTTDSSGRFLFSPVDTSKFSIAISNIGYIDFRRFYSFPSDMKNINLNAIIMKRDVKTLEEVVIGVPPIQIKEDTVEYKADSFKVKPNSMVEDLLKKLPGVQVDKNGNVTAQGKQVTKVRVNGKDFFGGDVQTATRELPADIIDKVQVIDDYGDQAAVSGIKDGDPDKIINLQLKKDKNKGAFGRATAGYGTDDRYTGTINANMFSDRSQLSLFGNANNTNNSLFNIGGNGGSSQGGGGTSGGGGGGGGIRAGAGTGALIAAGANAMGLGSTNSQTGTNQDGINTTYSIGTNYRTDFGVKNSFYGSYSFTRRNSVGNTNVSQQNFFEDKTFVNNQNKDFDNWTNNHRVTANLELNLDSFNYIKISPQFTYGGNKNQNLGSFEYFEDNNVMTSEGFNRDSALSQTPNFGTNILFNHKFRKRGRNFSANVNFGFSNTDLNDDLINFTRSYDTSFAGGHIDLNQNQLIDQYNKNHNYAIRMTYSEPIMKDRFLDITYSHTNSYSSSDRKTYLFDPATGDTLLVNALSNAYENTFIYDRAGVNIRTVKKKYSYSFGVNIQPVYLKGYSLTKDSAYTPQHQVNILPVARFTYNFSKTKSLGFNYNSSASQPSFTQLQPVRDITNPQYQTQGNPNLQPQFSHNFNLLYNNFNFISGRVLFTNINVNLIQDRIVNNNISLGEKGAQLSIPENVNGYYSVTGFYAYSKPFENRKYVVSLNGSANFNHDVGLVDSAKNVGYNWIAWQGANFDFNYKDWLELGVSGRYSLNSTRYTISQQNRYTSTALVIGSTMRADLPGSFTLRYDFDYTINQGLADNVEKNLAILNASIEKVILKKKNGFIRVSGFDIFNQNSNISRQVNGNSIIDTRTTRLTRYFMLSFTYRLNRFTAGQQGQQQQGQQQQRQVRPF